MSNLHLLLRVKSFERWPLRVTFFVEEVYHAWEKWLKTTPFKLRSGIRVELETPKVLEAFLRPGAEENESDVCDTVGNGRGIDGIDVSYESSKPHLEKSGPLLKESKTLACGVCAKAMDPDKSITLVCPEECCTTVSHMTCLSASFLRQEGKPGAILPLQGKCPGCDMTTYWSTLMRELSLRTRGEKEVASLFKKRRTTAASRAKTTAAAAAAAEALDEDADSADEGDSSDGMDSLDEAVDQDVGEVLQEAATRRATSGMDSEEYDDVDDWYHREDDVDVDTKPDVDISQTESRITASITEAAKATVPAADKFAPIVIEDSDWDEAEGLD